MFCFVIVIFNLLSLFSNEVQEYKIKNIVDENIRESTPTCRSLKRIKSTFRQGLINTF
jgi:hypothetical protein